MGWCKGCEMYEYPDGDGPRCDCDANARKEASARLAKARQEKAKASTEAPTKAPTEAPTKVPTEAPTEQEKGKDRSFEGTWTGGKHHPGEETGGIKIGFTYTDSRGLADINVDGKDKYMGTVMNHKGEWSVSIVGRDYWYAMKWNGKKLEGQYGAEEDNGKPRGTVSLDQMNVDVQNIQASKATGNAGYAGAKMALTQAGFQPFASTVHFSSGGRPFDLSSFHGGGDSCDDDDNFSDITFHADGKFEKRDIVVRVSQYADPRLKSERTSSGVYVHCSGCIRAKYDGQEDTEWQVTCHSPGKYTIPGMTAYGDMTGLKTSTA